ncbi:MAG: hypothetical protein PHW52_00565 [Candidatus Pacebacteria bacterium]|nr:hypothetical protein [Candidatus Paceibacterota bacterium]
MLIKKRKPKVVKTKTTIRNRKKKIPMIIWVYLILVVASTFLCVLHGDSLWSSLLAGLLIATIIMIAFFFLSFILKSVKMVILLIIAFVVCFLIGFGMVYLLEMAGCYFFDYGTANMLQVAFVKPTQFLGGAIVYTMLPFIGFCLLGGFKS